MINELSSKTRKTFSRKTLNIQEVKEFLIQPECMVIVYLVTTVSCVWKFEHFKSAIVNLFNLHLQIFTS